jgi:ribose 5-phosphate isomerase A
LSWIEGAKKRAAIEAVKHVRDKYTVGLGTGSTTAYAIREIGRRVRDEGLELVGIATSSAVESIAIEEGISLTTLDLVEKIDIAIDGADQVDSNLDLIKGLGGALTREKVVDGLAEVSIIIVDETKLTSRLGTNMKVPVEVLPFALTPVLARLKEIAGKPTLRLTKDERPVITDNGNYIVDADFGPIDDPRKLSEEIKLIPGVLDNGLFVDVADIVYVGHKEGCTKLERK